MSNTPIRRTDQVSERTMTMVRAVNAQQIQKVHSDKRFGKDITASSSAPIRFSTALSQGRFTSVGLGLYKEADAAEGIGRIWLRQTLKNEVTGDEEDWLVVYTTDEDEIIKQVADRALWDLKKVAANPKPEDIPLAEGIKSKNITMDETGGGGTATVTIDFADPAKGLDFYQNEIPTGGTPATKPQEEESPDEAAKGEKVPPVPQPPAGQTPGATFPQGGLPEAAPQQVQTSLNRKVSDLREIRPAVNQFQNQLRSNNGMDFIGEPIEVGMFTATPQVESGLVYANVSSDTLNVDLNRIIGGSKALLGNQDSYTDNLISLLHQLGRYAGDSGIRSSGLVNREEQTVFNPSISQISRKGTEGAIIYREHFQDGIRYSFVSEAGQQFVLPWKAAVRPGGVFERADTGVICRVARYQDVRYAFEDELVDDLASLDFEEPVGADVGSPEWVDNIMADANDHFSRAQIAPDREDYISYVQSAADAEGFIDVDWDLAASYYDTWGANRASSSLQKAAVDISDEIPPMGWSTSDSDTNTPSGAGQPLPPQPVLQDPNSTENSDVLYDSAKDTGPQFQTTIDPSTKSVNVRFLDSAEQQALDEAMKEQAPQQAQVPQQQQQAPQQQAPQQPGQMNFDEQEVPVNY